MVVFLAFVGLLFVVAAAAWSYKRKVREREAASAERMKAMMEVIKAGRAPAPRDAAAPGLPATGPAQEAKPAAETVAREAPLVARTLTEFAATVVLDAAQQEWLRALRAALPRHEIVPRANLAAFLRVGDTFTGFEREARERRLAAASVDYLVCDEAWRPVCAVCVSAAHDAVKSACARAGVRCVTLAGRDNLRAQILGA